MDDGRLLHGRDLVLGFEKPSVPSPQAAHYPKFHNDGGVAEFRIGVREFNCIGMSPPHDHPHVYLNMGAQEVVLCPYCATRFRFDPRLRLLEIEEHDIEQGTAVCDHGPASLLALSR